MQTAKLGFIASALALVAFSQAFSQSKAPTVRSGVYTAAQATAGEALYKANCASCHGAELLGKGQTPPLEGADFLVAWRGMSLGVLFEKMQSSMPADKPGSLKLEENAAILAYLLKANKMPTGSTPLSADPDALKMIEWGN